MWHEVRNKMRCEMRWEMKWDLKWDVKRMWNEMKAKEKEKKGWEGTVIIQNENPHFGNWWEIFFFFSIVVECCVGYCVETIFQLYYFTTCF